MSGVVKDSFIFVLKPQLLFFETNVEICKALSNGKMRYAQYPY